jgi:hypothetical protein
MNVISQRNSTFDSRYKFSAKELFYSKKLIIVKFKL